jgi:RimJ/RimL family protein N-acetyltransferase
MPAMRGDGLFPISDGVVAVRPWEDDDLPALLDAIDDAEIYRWIDLIPQPYTEDDGRQWLAESRDARTAGTATNFCVVDAADGRVLGGIGVRWSPERDVGEVGYWVRADARGRGVGRALMQAATERARQLGLTLLWLTTHDESDACAFYEAVGYTKLGVIPGYSLRPDGSAAPGAFYYKELRGSP